ncbi:hypothetical protein G7048_11015 [Diaphorobacter sp. HDW4B]|uniref:hypothetical protein n=1 Tax=Diaphorobacter sp. HDW4B TaxID=2714925 RepID=UPI00140C5468|nr:hypothetical protein [Diaphorobacter sp. HDW4B]QIL70846.1 hypothetical protein G7048_11015 [Diaphorobacter sp. HDW4B]
MFKKIVAAMALLGVSATYAMMPQAGTWSVTGESKGKPGRGFGIDVQNDTLVMQMYAYDANGNPTFYLTAGKITNNTYTGVLNKYRGGRYFGSGDISGVDDGIAGTVTMRFVSGTEGYIKFPNEAEKPISRFSFGYTLAPESLRGVWTLVAISRTSASLDKVDYFTLERTMAGSGYGTGAIASADYQYVCENLTSGPNAGLTMCLKFNSTGSVIRANYFLLSVNDGEGIAGTSGATANDPLFVKRVTNTSGVATGIQFKSGAVASDVSNIDAAQFANALQNAAENVVDRALLEPHKDDTPVR